MFGGGIAQRRTQTTTDNMCVCEQRSERVDHMLRACAPSYAKNIETKCSKVLHYKTNYGLACGGACLSIVVPKTRSFM